MELSEVVNTQYAFPVGVVLICAVLVFAFGFKSAEQPAFAQLTYTGDDRKPAGKKRKIKDKKIQTNGHATTVNEDNAETKHKTNDAVGSKLSVSKTVVKQAKDNKHDTEKSPAKDVSNKAVVRQQKQNKQETSAKEQQSKPGTMETVNKSVASKAQKENKKDAAEPQTKQLKEKKQDILDKSPSKDSNKMSTSKQSKGRGKENEVEEIKNQKNQKNLAKLKAEEKPLDFDDGEWEQALSRKDKKNRKKDDPSVTDDAVPENIVKKETGSPSKKKKAKSSDVGNAEAVLAEETKIMDNNEKTPERKPSKKEQKAEVEISPEKEAVPVVEVTVTPEIKSDEEAGIILETAVKSKKKGKKKSVIKSAEPEIPVATETTIETQEVTQPPPVVETKVLQNKQNEVKEEVKHHAESVPKSEPDSIVAFDELGDVWKEAKAQKKSKKKVRKDQ